MSKVRPDQFSNYPTVLLSFI